MNSAWHPKNATYPLRFVQFVDCRLPGAKNGEIAGTTLFTVLRDAAEIVSHRLNSMGYPIL